MRQRSSRHRTATSWYTTVYVVAAAALLTLLPSCLLQPVAADQAWGMTENTTTTSNWGARLGDPNHVVELTAHGILTAASCVALLIVLSFDLVSCAFAMFGLSVFLRISGIITTSEALAGLMNTSVVTVQLLVVLTAPIAKLPLVKKLMARMLLPPVSAAAVANAEVGGGPKVATMSMTLASFKICVLTYALSWFVGNIPVTAILTPLVHQHCLDHDLPSSQLLMQVQVASLIGGTFSKIGVSTTMLINGMMETRGLGTLAFFETIRVAGIPALFALLYMTIAPRWLLPHHLNMVAHVKANVSQFLVELGVLGSSPMVGKRVGEVRQQLLPDGCDIVQLVAATDGTTHAPPHDDQPIGANDVIAFTGAPAALEYMSRCLHLEWRSGGDDGSFASGGGQHSPHHHASPGASRGGVASSPHGGTTIVLAGDGAVSPTSPSGGDQNMSLWIGNNSSFQGMERSLRLSMTAHLRNSVRRSMNKPAGNGLGATMTGAMAPAGGATRVSLAAVDDAHDPTVDANDVVFGEVVLSFDAAVIGRAASSLRPVYRMALLAHRRKGVNLSASSVLAKRMTLCAGDTVLLLGPRACFRKYEHRGDFLVVTLVNDEAASDGGGADVPTFVAVPRWFPFGTFLLEDSHGAIVPQPGSTDKQQQLHGESRPLLMSARPRSVVLSEAVPSPAAGEEEGSAVGSPPAKGSTSSNSASTGVGVSAPEPDDASPQRGGGGVGVLRRYRKVLQIPKWYPYLTLVVFSAAIFCSIAGLELIVCCEVAVIATLLLKLRTLEGAYKSLKLEVFVVMAFSFGLGTAMTKSGLSMFLAAKIDDAHLNGWALKLLISCVASAMSNIISSKAAAQVLFPVVVDICDAIGEDPIASIGVLAVSIIVSLITPYAHASGLIVMGPGGYVTRDFYKFGTPLNLMMCLLVASTAHIVYG